MEKDSDEAIDSIASNMKERDYESINPEAYTKKTMDDLYGDGSDHIACLGCGMCADCGDCVCD